MSTRPIPEHCEIVGDVFNKNAPATPCPLRPKRLVSVNELSPIATCNDHGKDMNRFWKPTHPVTNVPITGSTIEYGVS